MTDIRLKKYIRYFNTFCPFNAYVKHQGAPLQTDVVPLQLALGPNFEVAKFVFILRGKKFCSYNSLMNVDLALFFTLSDEETIQSVKRPCRPLGSKNRPRVSSAPEVRETIASRLRRSELGKTRAPPKINYRETGRLEINSEDPGTQETANEEQGDDEVFLPVSIPGPSTINPTPDIGQEGDDEAEKDDETEKEKEATVLPKQRRKTQELVKMFDELLQRWPPSENTYRERALEKIRREEAIFNYTPEELVQMKRTSSETAKTIRESLYKHPTLWRSEEDSLNDNTTPEINVDEFLRDNSDQSEGGSSSNISPDKTEGIEDYSETEPPIIIEAEPSTSVNNVNTRNKNNLTPQNADRSRFTGYLGDGPETRPPIFGRVLIPDELAAMDIRYEHASGQIVDENGKRINETAETESTDPNNILIDSERERLNEKSPNITKLINSQNNNHKNKSRNSSEKSSDPDKSNDRPTTNGNITVGDDVGNHRFGPPFVAYDPPTFEEAEDLFAERHHRPKISSPSSSDENIPPKGPEIKIKFSISRDGLIVCPRSFTDCEIIKRVAKLLRDLKFINADDLHASKPSKGDVFVTKLGRCKIFTVFIKTKHFEKLDPIDLIEGLKNLRQSMHKHHIHSLRLLYDPFKKIHLIREESQIDSSINIEKLVNLYPYSNQSIWEAYGICATKFNYSICSSYLRINSHREIQAEIEQAKHRLRLHLEDPELEKVDKTNRKRRAPWFGFVGTIARELFGTMDYSDKEHITKEIDKLYQDNRELVHLFQNNTHIIKSEINEILKHETNLTERIRNLVRTSAYLQQSVNIQLSDLERSQLFLMAGDEHIHLMTNHLRTLNNAEEVIEDAKWGKLTYLTVSAKQLYQAAADMMKKHPTLNPPQPLDHIIWISTH
ncbi:Protein of unknown function [Cotesia congregata]|uniref:Uncharacterized protein n=1 Tax=Cotesia congregata TaxID=51543 RepID=A0A8J2H054_COTCN|nr:Protein of unknown function [Cotesia congregata]